MNEQREICLNAMAQSFEDWWTKRYTDWDPEAIAKINCWKPLAKAAWKARDEQVLAMADLIIELIQTKEAK